MRISNKEEFDRQNAFGIGQANSAFAQYFIGNSYLNPLTAVSYTHLDVYKRQFLRCSAVIIPEKYHCRKGQELSLIHI